MSQDQKPARIRLQAGPNGAAGAAGGGAPVVADGAAPAVGKGKGGKGGLLPVLLFLAGCIGGGVAVARLGPL